MAEQAEIVPRYVIPNKGVVVGNSPAMESLYRDIERFAPLDGAVVVTGERGTGKELVALLLYHLSPRKDKPFIAVNCPRLSLTPDVAKSELFGNRKGAYTGSDRETWGYFGDVGKGVLFLDEFADLKMELQHALLRPLQERVYERTGEVRPRKFEGRIIAATYKSIDRLIEEEKLSEALWDRLRRLHIYVPNLLERGTNDISLLAQYFCNLYSKEMHKHVTLDDGALQALLQYRWSGNVRELENFIYELVARKGSEGQQATLEVTDVNSLLLRRISLGRSHSVYGNHKKPNVGTITHNRLNDNSDEYSANQLIMHPDLEPLKELPIFKGVNCTLGSTEFYGGGATVKQIKAFTILSSLIRNKGNREKTAEEAGISHKTVGIAIKSSRFRTIEALFYNPPTYYRQEEVIRH